MYLISAYFDKEAERALQRLIDRVAEKTGNDFMVSHNVPPHMTISQIEAKCVDVLLPYVESLDRKLSGGRVQFVSPGMLLPYVICVMPVLNQYLMQLSEQIYEACAQIKETAVSRFYRPMSWLPHVTIGKTLEKEQMIAAVRVLQDAFVPFEAAVAEIGLAKVNPHEDVLKIKL